uniref:Uncharacterized protein n=1 Tax=Arion vulgaris TaxID=1028688 RepID=A0A0B6ZBG4_9EUPU
MSKFSISDKSIYRDIVWNREMEKEGYIESKREDEGEINSDRLYYDPLNTALKAKDSLRCTTFSRMTSILTEMAIYLHDLRNKLHMRIEN